MTSTSIADLIAAMDLTDATDRLVLADAMEDAGRDEEAALLRDADEDVLADAGRIVAQQTWWESRVRYAVHVADDNGWLDGCPDYEGVFFGEIPEGARYASSGEYDRYFSDPGHVEFLRLNDARAFARRCRVDGDWRTFGDGPDRVPVYEVQRLEPEDRP